ncbi:MAG: MFS transporter [Planctomycetota bacterium]|nr:MAG: MFS transporter [Planctomycetota bacterium]
MKSNDKYNLKYVWLICLVAAMGGLLFGYDWIVVGGAKPFYEPYFHLDSPHLKGFGTSSALIGCMFGAMLCGTLSDKVGRKRLLIMSGLLFMISAVGTALSNTFLWFNIYRIIGGIAMGHALNLSPMYIAEISPTKVRGMLVSVNQLTVMIGVLSAQVVNWLISLYDTQMPDNATAEMILQSWNGQYGWRWMFAAETIPASLFFLLMFLVPESVRWLVKDGQDSRAERILEKIGGADYARVEVANIKDTLSSEEIARVNFRDLLEPKLLKIILIGVFLAVLQQWCGMNVIFYYAADIFQAAGYNIKQTMLNIVVIGLVMTVSVFITIGTVDKVGRKTLMLVGTSALAVIYGLIGYSFHSNITGLPIVLLTLANVAFYSFTLAPVTWVLLSEIFPNRIRGAAMSISVIALWIGSFTLTYSFPTLNENLGTAQIFWLYGVICAVGFIFILFKLPKTKGKSLEQIERELVD